MGFESTQCKLFSITNSAQLKMLDWIVSLEFCKFFSKTNSTSSGKLISEFKVEPLQNSLQEKLIQNLNNKNSSCTCIYFFNFVSDFISDKKRFR